MCSWCWGYKPTLDKLKQQLPGVIQFEYVVGGLAPDTNLPMPPEMQQKLEGIWKQIERQLGTKFNYDFWKLCTQLEALTNLVVRLLQRAFKTLMSRC